MKLNKSYSLTTIEIKHALIAYINTITGENHKIDNVDGFALNQSSNDIREYTAYIGFEEEHRETPEDKNGWW